MILIVGLGNPGKKYENTRHNLGFMVVDQLAKDWTKGKIKWQNNQNFKSQILEIGGDLRRLTGLKSDKEKRVILVKPQTFMNNSGMAVKKLIDNYHLDLENLWVVHDDLDIPLGHLKIAKNKGAAGHHGVLSIINSLGSVNFIRFRFGIGQTKKEAGVEEVVNNPEKFVLEKFLPQEEDEVRQMIKKAVFAIEVALKEGIDKAMTQFNQ